jgi:hypothetical protein
VGRLVPRVVAWVRWAAAAVWGVPCRGVRLWGRVLQLGGPGPHGVVFHRVVGGRVAAQARVACQAAAPGRAATHKDEVPLAPAHRRCASQRH